jgi:hypothetical protein
MAGIFLSGCHLGTGKCVRDRVINLKPRVPRQWRAGDWRDDDGDAAATAGAISPVTLSGPAENKSTHSHKRLGHGTGAPLFDARPGQHGSSTCRPTRALAAAAAATRIVFPRVVSQGGGPAPPPPYARSRRRQSHRPPRQSLSAFPAAAPMRKSGCLMERAHDTASRRRGGTAPAAWCETAPAVVDAWSNRPGHLGEKVVGQNARSPWCLRF